MSLQAQVFVYTKFRPLGSLSADSVGNALPGYHLSSRERSQPSITKTIYRFGLVTNQRRPALVEYSYLSPPLPATLTVRESIMAKFLRPNKVVLVLKGRYAGKKAVIVKNTYRSAIIPVGAMWKRMDGRGALGWRCSCEHHSWRPSVPPALP